MRLKDIDMMADKDLEEIQKVLNYLEKHSFLARTKLDLNRLVEVDVEEHELCMNHEEFIRDYLRIRGVELTCTASDATYYLAGEKVKPVIPSQNIIKFLLLTKLFYNEKIEHLNFKELYFTKKEFRQIGESTGLFTEKIPDKLWAEALGFMKTHSLITFKGSVDELDDDVQIYIYPTIAIYVNHNIINSAEKVITEKEKEKMGEEECLKTEQ